jgi:hypothetical protein
MMSAVDLTHKMAEVKRPLAWTISISKDAKHRAAEEETEHSCLIIRTHLQYMSESRSTVEIQQQTEHDRDRMPPPPDHREVKETPDDTLRHQPSHQMDCNDPVAPADHSRTLLQTIHERVVSDVDIERASTRMELEEEH